MVPTKRELAARAVGRIGFGGGDRVYNADGTVAQMLNCETALELGGAGHYTTEKRKPAA